MDLGGRLSFSWSTYEMRIIKGDYCYFTAIKFTNTTVSLTWYSSQAHGHKYFDVFVRHLRKAYLLLLILTVLQTNDL